MKTHIFWKIYFWFLLVVVVALFGYHGLDWLEAIAVIAVFYAIFMAEYVAFCLYAFRSKTIWRQV